jgi:hypothetical protein
MRKKMRNRMQRKGHYFHDENKMRSRMQRKEHYFHDAVEEWFKEKTENPK